MYENTYDFVNTNFLTMIFLGVHPYEKQDHVNVRFVEETALKHTMTFLGLKYSWNNMFLKEAVVLLCKSIHTEVGNQLFFCFKLKCHVVFQIICSFV